MSNAQRIRRTVEEQMALPAGSVKDTDDRASLGMDSLDEIELVMAVEDEFGIEIPDESAEAWTNVESVIDYINGRCGGAEPSGSAA